MMNTFSLILPFGFLASPAIGWCLDNKGIIFNFTLLGSGLVTFAVFNLFKSIYWLQIFNFVLFTLVRAYFYGGVIAFYFKV